MSKTDLSKYTHRSFEAFRVYWNDKVKTRNTFSFSLQKKYLRNGTVEVTEDITNGLESLQSQGNALKILTHVVTQFSLLLSYYKGVQEIHASVLPLKMEGEKIEQLLPVSISLNTDASIEEHFNQVRDLLKTTFKYQSYPLELITPAFDYSNIVFEFDEILLSSKKNDKDLRVVIESHGDKTYLKLIGKAAIFSEEDLKSILKNFGELFVFENHIRFGMIQLGNYRSMDTVAFWKKELKGLVTPVLFNEGLTSDTYTAPIDKDIIAYLNDDSANYQGKTSSFFLGVLVLLTGYLSNQKEVLIGIEGASEEKSNQAFSILGKRITRKPFRTFIDPTISIGSFLDRVYKKMTSNEKLGNLTEYDIDTLSEHESDSTQWLDEIVFEYKSQKTSSKYSNVEVGESSSHLKWVIDQKDDCYTLTLRAEKILKSAINLERLFHYYIEIANFLVKNAELKIAQVDYLSHAEKIMQLQTFNYTARSYPDEKTTAELFEAQAFKHPDKIALQFKDKKLTFATVNNLSNQFGHYLKNNFEVVKDDRVAVQLERSEWMVVVLLGILKAGAAYVPTSPSYPKERLDFIVEDCQAKVLIDGTKLLAFQATKDQYSQEHLGVKMKSSDLMYIIYTSGSSGQPKGCMLEHRGVINRIDWMWETYDFDANDVFLQKTNYTFDVSIPELFAPLCWGAEMIICEEEDVVAPERMANLIEFHGVTSIHFVPSMLNIFIKEIFESAKSENLKKRLASVKRLFASGEELPLSFVKRWYEYSDIPVYNLYGPTEASIEVTAFKTCPTDEVILIGKPISNTQVYILDESLQLLPTGVTGEIGLSGDGLARGYLNQPGLTKERFVINPYHNESRIYLTGDLGRWTSDGQVEYLGRKDKQVKIRGYRIELGEIEAALEKHEEIRSAVVLVKEDERMSKQLLAFVLVQKNILLGDLREYLKNSLPVYMIPSLFVELDVFPLNDNGKVDTKKLLSLNVQTSRKAYDFKKPETKFQKDLVHIWSQVLNLPEDTISIATPFFDLGGDSLKGILILQKIKEQFKIEISLMDLLENDTITDVSTFLEERIPSDNSDLKKYEIII